MASAVHALGNAAAAGRRGRYAEHDVGEGGLGEEPVSGARARPPALPGEEPVHGAQGRCSPAPTSPPPVLVLVLVLILILILPRDPGGRIEHRQQDPGRALVVPVVEAAPPPVQGPTLPPKGRGMDAVALPLGVQDERPAQAVPVPQLGQGGSRAGRRPASAIAIAIAIATATATATATAIAEAPLSLLRHDQNVGPTASNDVARQHPRRQVPHDVPVVRALVVSPLGL